MEDYYTEAREKGVIFIRFDKDAPPRVESADDAVRVLTLTEAGVGHGHDLTGQ